jgi:2-polyprenyl-3-methyl-5-hydroxy-6-metoxy-1,4-benzoquinol methylase
MENELNFLASLFQENYTLDKLINVNKEDFIKHVTSRIDKISHENFVNSKFQRDLSIKFHWGHNHNFGDDLNLVGNMKNRHIDILNQFVNDYGLPKDLSNKKVLDIGVWTGGISLLLCAMGADVYAIEEVNQYAEMVNYLSYAFGIDNKLRCYAMSLYDFIPIFSDTFDYVIYSGVIYHVSDPLLSLRLIFSSLKDGGTVFLETMGIDESRSVCLYEGPDVFSSGDIKKLNRTGWNYFIPSSKCLENWCYNAGFQKIKIGSYHNKRILGKASREYYTDFCRAGLSKNNIR